MNMKKEEDKFVPSDILEGMTSISALFHADPSNNNRSVLKIWVDEAKRKSKVPQIGFLIAKSHEKGFPVEFVSSEQIESYAIGNTHGGILAFCSSRDIPGLTSNVIQPNGFYVYLEGVEDPYNFGYALRSLYAAGVTGIVLPKRNWMQAAGVVARASAGASELLPMYLAPSTEEVLPMFSGCGYTTLCAGIRNSVSIFDEQFPLPVLLVIGGEKRGISHAVLDQADHIVRIDYGTAFNGSLSAASAATVMGFEIFRQNRNLLLKEVASDKL